MTTRGMSRFLLYAIYWFCVVFFVFQYLGWTWRLVAAYALIQLLYGLIDGSLKDLKS